ncbi:MAG: hypothetical protein LW870_04430 [Pirellula sp.]|jgi:hypothetical protein|nr:hypothetical protein [Pirellula sp.]
MKRLIDRRASHIDNTWNHIDYTAFRSPIVYLPCASEKRILDRGFLSQSEKNFTTIAVSRSSGPFWHAVCITSLEHAE